MFGLVCKARRPADVNLSGDNDLQSLLICVSVEGLNSFLLDLSPFFLTHTHPSRFRPDFASAPLTLRPDASRVPIVGSLCVTLFHMLVALGTTRCFFVKNATRMGRASKGSCCSVTRTLQGKGAGGRFVT